MTNVDLNIEKVSKLANLKLSASQKKKFSKQLKDVLSYFNTLEEVTTNKIEPIGQITDLENITRNDQTAPSLSQEEALKNAARTYKGFFEVDAIFEKNNSE